MAEVAIAVGVLPDGSVLTIDEFDRRIHQGRVLCPHCGYSTRLAGRQGNQRAHCFAHYPGTGLECRADPCRDLHVLVQDEIANGADLVLPSFCEFRPADFRPFPFKSEDLLYLSLTNCVKEASFEAFGQYARCSVDVEGVMPNGVKLFVEVAVHHKTEDASALEARARLGRPCVEFHCKDLLDSGWDRKIIRQALKDPSRWRWIRMPILSARVIDLDLVLERHVDGDLLVRFENVGKQGYDFLFRSNGAGFSMDKNFYGKVDDYFPLNRVKWESLGLIEKRVNVSGAMNVGAKAKSGFMLGSQRVEQVKTTLFGFLPIAFKPINPDREALERTRKPRSPRKKIALPSLYL